MIDFVGTPPFLRMALRVAMLTMHFHKARTGLLLMEHFLAFRGPREQFGTNERLFRCARYVKIDPRVIEISTNSMQNYSSKNVY